MTKYEKGKFGAFEGKIVKITGNTKVGTIKQQRAECKYALARERMKSAVLDKLAKEWDLPYWKLMKEYIENDKIIERAVELALETAQTKAEKENEELKRAILVMCNQMNKFRKDIGLRTFAEYDREQKEK